KLKRCQRKATASSVNQRALTLQFIDFVSKTTFFDGRVIAAPPFEKTAFFCNLTCYCLSIYELKIRIFTRSCCIWDNSMQGEILPQSFSFSFCIFFVAIVL